MLDSLTLLRAMNGIHEEDVIMAGEPYFYRKSRKPGRTKRIVTLALAAALLLALGATAYAAYFSMSRREPAKDENFRISWAENPSGYLEWKNAKLAITFPETPVSREIEFRPGWLPDAMASLNTGDWVGRLTAEFLVPGRSGNGTDAYANMNQPLLIDRYPMSMFNQGGALLLLYSTPGEITEEHWDELDADVMYFHATQHFDAVPERNIEAYTLEKNIVLLSNPEAGWVVRLCGEIGMEELLKVARHLEIRETGKTFIYDDFENHYAFFDGGVG